MKLNKVFLALAIILLSSTFSWAQVKVVVGVTGSIFNYVDKTPISIEILVLDNAGVKVNSTKSNAASNGYFYVTGLYPGNTYSFVINDKNYLSEKFDVTIPNTNKYIEISKDFLLKPNKSGTEIRLNVSPFESNKSKLKPGSVVILAELLNTLKSNPKTKFRIVSYPDSDNNPANNEILTKARAQALVDYFELNGVDSINFEVQGNKNTDPKNPPLEKRSKGKKYIGSIYFVLV